jgi:hypothetical protein
LLLILLPFIASVDTVCSRLRTAGQADADADVYADAQR